MTEYIDVKIFREEAGCFYVFEHKDVTSFYMVKYIGGDLL